MIHQILADFLLDLPQCVIVVWLCCRLVTVPRPRLLLALYILVLLGTSLLISWTLPLDVRMVYVLKPTILMSMDFLLLLCFTRGSLTKRLLLITLLFALQILSEMILLGVYELLLGPTFISQLPQDGGLALISKSLHVLVYALLCLLLDLFWRRLVRAGKRESYGLYPLALYPLSQCIMLAFIESMRVRSPGPRPSVIFIEVVIVAASLLADVLLLRMFHQLREQHALQQRQAALEHELALQEHYYRQLAESAARLSHLRHDMNNQLQTAYALVDRGEAARAGALLEELAASLRALEGEAPEKEEGTCGA